MDDKDTALAADFPNRDIWLAVVLFGQQRLDWLRRFFSYRITGKNRRIVP